MPTPAPDHPFTPFMRRALALAEQGRWHTAPNPTVGAVLVQDGRIVAEGYHTAFGLPHAEVACLQDAARKQIDPSRCTLVVTLEPCNHQGKTPPCSRAVLDARIPHVVIGLCDPNPKAQGGADFLREHGVRVETGILEQECRDQIADFLHWIATPLPYTFLKMATTLDGKIATRTGHSRWITGPQARERVHVLRSTVQAVIVGGETFRADNPQLTARTAASAEKNNSSGLDRQPLAIIVTRNLPTQPHDYTLLNERAEQTVFWTSRESAASVQAEKLTALGATVYPLQQTAHGLDLSSGLRWLREEKHCLYTLCEGGGRLALSFLEQGLANEFHLHMAPKIIGDSAAPDVFTGRTITRMDEALGMRITHTETCGSDVLLTLRPQDTCICLPD